jgi:hypothetical protein
MFYHCEQGMILIEKSSSEMRNGGSTTKNETIEREKRYRGTKTSEIMANAT